MAKLVHVEQDGTGIKRRRVESPGISMEMVLSRCHDVFDCFDQSIIVSDMSQESPSIVYVNPFARSVFGIPSGNDRFPFAEFANGLKRCTSSISSPICSCESFTGVHKASGVDLKLHSSPFLVDSIKCGRIWRIEEMCHVEEFNAHQLLKQRTQEILELKKQKMEDILERKKLEEELKVVSAVAQKTDTGVIITDKRRKVIWINEAFVKSTGYTLKEMYGKSPGSVLQCEQSDPEVIEKMRDCLDSAREFCVDIVNRRKNGMLMMFNIDVFPVFDDDGELLHFVALQREVSDKALREKKSSAVEQAKANALANQLKVDFMMKMV